jgi:hypothetical protein
MGIDKTAFDRMLAGEIGSEDPTLGHVASFLDQVQTTEGLPMVAGLEAEHLARVHAAPLALGYSPRTQRRGRLAAPSGRLLVGGIAAILVALTAGVGVAAAMGVNPLQSFQHLLASPAPVKPGGTESKLIESERATPPGGPTSVPTPAAPPAASASPEQSDSTEPSASPHPNESDNEHSKRVGSSEHPTPHSTHKGQGSSSKDGSKVKKDTGNQGKKKGAEKSAVATKSTGESKAVTLQKS